jgi:uncharacterized hydrophobic protein (TIGR00341 family)
MVKNKKKTKNWKPEILNIKKSEQYRTVEELMEKSRPSSVYYTLLILSSIIVTAGLIVENAAVVIGGMIFTPVLTPIFLISLGISIGDIKFSKKTAIFVLKSLLIILLSGLFLGILFGVEGEPQFFPLAGTGLSLLGGAVLYFIVALVSGLAATLAWVRKEISEILPGVAVAVALVPPLVLVGLGFSVMAIDVIRYNFFMFFFNLLGVLVGSLLVFSLLKFYKVEQKVEDEVEKQEKREEEKEK